MTEIVLIAAVARNGVIGNNNDLPFRLSSDLKHFKALTLGHPVVMGRNTHESIGRALPGRPNLVLSGDPDYRAEGCETYQDLDTALDRAVMLAEGLDKDAVFVIGGGQIYEQAMESADRLEITHVDLEAVGSVHFPTVSDDIWVKTASESVQASPKDDADMEFATYRRATSEPS